MMSALSSVEWIATSGRQSKCGVKGNQKVKAKGLSHKNWTIKENNSSRKCKSNWRRLKMSVTAPKDDSGEHVYVFHFITDFTTTALL